MSRAARGAAVGFGGESAPRAGQDVERRRLGPGDRGSSVYACDLARKRRERVNIACLSRRVEALRVRRWKLHCGVERASRAVSGAASARDFFSLTPAVRWRRRCHNEKEKLVCAGNPTERTTAQLDDVDKGHGTNVASYEPIINLILILINTGNKAAI